MESSLSFLGFYSECIGAAAPLGLDDGMIMPSDHDDAIARPLFTGRYCLAKFELPNMSIESLRQMSGLSKNVSAMKPKVGICMPSTCTAGEIKSIASQVLFTFIDTKNLTLECSGDKAELQSDFGAQFVLVFFILVLTLVAMGTTIDHFKLRGEQPQKIEWIRNRSTTVTSVTSLTSVNSERPDFSARKGSPTAKWIMVMDILLTFSLIKNVKKIFSVSERSNLKHHPDGTTGHIEVLHGIRVLMMVWIIVGHSFSFAMQWLFFKNPKEMDSAPKNLLSQIFANGTFSVDSFLFISGLLVTNLCMKQMRKTSGRLPLSKFYLHRYLRMTPLMMAIIAFTANLLKYASEGPSFQVSTVMFDAWCKQNWWLNAVYLHNFVNRQNMCLSHSWYSAVDMQLYFVAPIILIPLYRRPKVGYSIMVFMALASIVFTATITIMRNYPAVPYMNDLIGSETVDEYYGNVYIKPYARMGPYLVGMGLGYFMYIRDNKVRLSHHQLVAGWIFAITANLGILFAMLPVNAGYALPAYLAGLYSSTSRIIWAMSLAWVVVACSAGKGGLLGRVLSARIWLPWSRLTYAAYLIHPVVMAVFYGSRHSTFEFSHFLMFYIALGNLVLTYFLSLVLCAVFESPIISLEKLLSEGKTRSRSDDNNNNNNNHLTPC